MTPSQENIDDVSDLIKRGNDILDKSNWKKVVDFCGYLLKNKTFLIIIRALEKLLVLCPLGVNFTNILHPAFMPLDPKSPKKTDGLTVFFAHLESACINLLKC